MAHSLRTRVEIFVLLLIPAGLSLFLSIQYAWVATTTSYPHGGCAEVYAERSLWFFITALGFVIGGVIYLVTGLVSKGPKKMLATQELVERRLAESGNAVD